ncbi:nagb/rpia/CoA transferase-like protein [Tothia fuscella]|uniref:Translation initiation factor eIF2B subunit beta n=1 Tax=Tothia fuscella TaxID=1048955 RepID=A0A9P4TYW3_9PEZI|nr:nagb/rpia/CoA transferase-like protein [Tothia fuscella]
MPSATVSLTPGLSTFQKSLKTREVESSIEQFISLLKRRQIRNSRPCALATAELLLKVVGEFPKRDAAKLFERIRSVGQRLIAAQPREMVVGNIVRRVLSLVRLIINDLEHEDDSLDASGANTPAQLHSPRPKLHSTFSMISPLKHGMQPLDSTALHDPSGLRDLPSRPPLLTSHTSYAPTGAPTVTSLFGLFSHPTASDSNTSTPPNYNSPSSSKPISFAEKIFKIEEHQQDIKTDVVDGIKEILEELEIVDEQIASNALDHIHSNEIILTHTSSLTVQKFLLTAARKRKFTVVHVEGYPNESDEVHDTLLNGARTGEPTTDERWKPLTAAGITVILIPDSAVFAIMSRVNKVILATHTVLANGGLVAACGAKVIAQAAKCHQTPVVVLSGVYKLSPVYPFDCEELIEFGDAGRVAGYEEGEFVERIAVENPLYDYVAPELVDLYISNLGGHAPSYLYHVVAEHYNVEDVNLGA